MVKKLLKYEFKARAPMLLLMWGIIIAVACAARILAIIVYHAPETENPAVSTIIGIVSIFHTSSVAMLVIGCIAMVVITMVLNVVRFYKNLYSAEGYLSFTLPVSRKQHIFAKTFVSFVMTAGGILVCFIAGLINTDFESLRAMLEQTGLNTLIDAFVAECGTVNCVLYIIEAVLVIVAFILCGIMKYNACLSIGQLARRRKILLSFGVYAGLYFARQFISTVFVAILMPLTLFNNNFNGFIERINEWFEGNSAAGFHIILCVNLAIYVIGFVLFSIATYLPMKKKLNLE